MLQEVEACVKGRPQVVCAHHMWLHPERLSPDEHPRAPPCPQMYKDDGLSRGDVEALLKRFANQVPPKPCNGGRSRRAVNLRLHSCCAHSGAARA